MTHSRPDENLKVRQPGSGRLAAEARFEALYELFVKLAMADTLTAALDEVLSAALDVVGADGAYIRVFEPVDVEPECNPYPFVVQKGFSEAYINYFSALAQPVDRDARQAVFNGQSVFIEDMTTHPAFLAHREVVLAEGYRSMQATPVLSHNGSGYIGVICTCFLSVHLPSPEALEALDLYAEVAGTIVAQHREVAELARRHAALADVVERQREALLRIHERATVIEARALSHDPEEILLLARGLSYEIGRSATELEGLDAPEREPEELSANRELHPYGLSSRELAVLVHVWRGLSDKQIALQLGISRFTVAKHLGAGMRKLNVESRTQASVIVERESIYTAFEGK